MHYMQTARGPNPLGARFQKMLASTMQFSRYGRKPGPVHRHVLANTVAVTQCLAVPKAPAISRETVLKETMREER